MIVIPSILASYQSLKDGTLKLVFETNEPTIDQVVSIAQGVQSFGYLAFKKDQFKESETKALESLESNYNEFGKTKSQRLRNVLYRNFEQDKEGYDVFDDYYNNKMEKLIIHFKDKLE